MRDVLALACEDSNFLAGISRIGGKHDPLYFPFSLLLIILVHLIDYLKYRLKYPRVPKSSHYTLSESLLYNLAIHSGLLTNPLTSVPHCFSLSRETKTTTLQS